MMPVAVDQTWTRKVPADDGWDSVVVVGIQQVSEELPDEYVLRQSDGMETVQVAAEDLQSVFVLTAETSGTPAPPEDADARSEWT